MVLRKIPKPRLKSLNLFKPVIMTRPAIRLLPGQALRSVTSKHGFGVYASSDTLFKGAIFGRDSLEVAEDLMAIKPRLAEKIILTLASFQGEEFDKEREEEPGKIIHELRTSVVDGKHIDEVSQQILERLSSQWGGTDTSLVYYGSVDSTPLFIRTLARYCQLYGKQILARDIRLRSGYHLPLTLILENAVDWLEGHLRAGGSGLLEYHRINPRGIENQAWKDSKEFYVHENGKHVNHSKPISSIELQAVAYDALILAAELLPSRSKALQEQAANLRSRVIELLWQPHRHYFALGTDYDEKNKLRIIATKTANPAEMLDSFFFDDLPTDRKELYVSGIVKNIMSDSFLTDGGIRSRALEEAELISFWDYHGSYTSWPKETYDIAKGLRHQGFPLLARELENRLLNVVSAMRAYPEFIYVDARGRLLGMPAGRQNHGELVFVESTNRPEKIQAWTVSAFISISSRSEKASSFKITRQAWQSSLEKEILRSIPSVHRLKSEKELAARYPAYPYELVKDER